MEQRLIDDSPVIEQIECDIATIDSVDGKPSIVPLIIRDYLQSFIDLLKQQPTVDAVPVGFIKALHTDYVQRSKALQGRTGYMYTLYAIALENLVQSFDYDNAMADEMKTERNCADGERRTDEQ